MAGRGRPPKNNTEEGMDFDQTTIEGMEVKQTTSKRGRPSGSKSVKKDIIADKLNVMIGCMASLAGFDYQYEASDYTKEATALSNISNEHSVVAKALDFLDPLVMVAGIFDKFRRMKRKPKKGNVQPQPQNDDLGQRAEQQPPSNNIVNFFKHG